MSKPNLQDLLERWIELRDRGTPVSAEDLCRDCPDLIPHLRVKLDAQVPATESTPGEAPRPSQSFAGLDLQANMIVEDVASKAAREEAETRRARLRLAVTVFLVHWLVFVALLVFLNYPIEEPFSAGFEVVVLAVMVVLLGRRKGQWSVRTLRWLELLIFGAITQRIFLGQATVYTSGDFLEMLNTAEGMPLHLAADSFAAPWFEVIIVYGLLIPNSWRLCAAVVTGLMLLPLVQMSGFAYRVGVLGHPVIGVTLTKIGLRLAFASAIAILGRYRMQRLAHEAREARELGQYSLKHRLGQGGMAEVYLAEHKLLRRRCAIKLIRAENAGDPHAQRRFAREVQTMSRIRHPNVVEIFDCGVSAEGKFYYVMEYLQGLNLDELVRRHGPLPPERVLYLLRQTAYALQALHANGVIHRDIKPSNIFLSAPDVVKVLDFGLVHTATSAGSARLTRDDRIVGTPAFMSPEQIDLSHSLDIRSDLYATGLVGYFLLAGFNPFMREDVQAIFTAHVRDEAPPLRDLVPAVPADLHATIHRLLAKDPAQRFPDPSSLLAALDRCAGASEWTTVRAAAWWSTIPKPD